VTDVSTGLAVAGATVQAGTAVVTTGLDGSFHANAIPFGRVLVAVSSAQHIPHVYPIAINAAQAIQQLELQLQPSATAPSFDPLTAQVVTAAGSVARVALNAGSLATAAGTPPVGSVTAKVVAVVPTMMPGDFTSSTGDHLQGYGAISVELSDAAGARLNLAAGKTAVIRIPAVAAPGASLPATSPLFHFDEATGYWVREGSAVLAGAGADRYYEATVSHFSEWGSGEVMNTVNVRGRVLDADGYALGGVRVVCTGIDYFANVGEARNEYLSTNSGSFVVPMKSNANADCSASLNGVVSNVVGVHSATSDVDLTQDLVLPITSASTIGLADTFTRVDSYAYPLGGVSIQVQIPFETVGIVLDWNAITLGQTHWEVTPIFNHSDGGSTFSFSLDGNSTYIGANRIDNASTPLKGVMAFGGSFRPSAADNVSDTVSITFLVRLVATQPNSRLGRVAKLNSELKQITLSLARPPVVANGLTWLPMIQGYMQFPQASAYCAGKGYRLPTLAEALAFYPTGPFGTASGSQVGEVWTTTVDPSIVLLDSPSWLYVVSGITNGSSHPPASRPAYWTPSTYQNFQVLTLCVKSSG
jgi:hypothetical protein